TVISRTPRVLESFEQMRFGFDYELGERTDFHFEKTFRRRAELESRSIAPSCCRYVQPASQ
ncbi:MAG: hypothetical protein WAJ91_12615, partial [Rhodoplanes sp.]